MLETSGTSNGAGLNSHVRKRFIACIGTSKIDGCAAQYTPVPKHLTSPFLRAHNVASRISYTFLNVSFTLGRRPCAINHRGAIMHSLQTIHKLERQNTEASRILGLDHSEAEKRNKEQLDADIKESQERLQAQQ